ncbi:hypothetical protein B488_10760 [Liberibacter crescens BT-1]|uniref:TadE-like domain-containing protein n=1 Tax=Liberibacter crescens (strain BT-1) TaxID=1215343 RepID=L0EWQ6_LIBCB|nr:TadE/TadG family type IV pilus assembly protein [Liberibacter crescens]AGA65068.1 hypothetical protein B488_10760 [Liberibacter crescens BT-1]AMC13060.1 pilus assembly protein TadG [Liberibacter crescens]
MIKNLFKKVMQSILSRDGAAALEFALLAFPYFLVVFAIFETSIALIGEQIIENATYEISRQIRTGDLRVSNTTEAQFRQKFCDQISILISCSSSEISNPYNLYINVQELSSMDNIKLTIPRKSSSPDSDIDTSGFGFKPGGPSTLNEMQVFYHWPITLDIMRKYMTTVKHSDKSEGDYLIMATMVFKNEPF